MIAVGAPAPRFQVDGPEGRKVGFDTLAGRFIVLGFVGRASEPAARSAIEAAASRLDAFDGKDRTLFWVSADPADQAPGRLPRAANRIGALWDGDLSISRAFGVAQAASQGIAYGPCWIVLDPRLRVLHAAPIADVAATFDLIERLPPPGGLDGDIPAPVLVLPRLFEPELCRRLIETYEAGAPVEGGFMRQVEGRTVRVLDPQFKRRSDVLIGEGPLRDALRARLADRLAPELERAFQFRATRIERYLVACYDSASGGFFKPHRDNTTTGTAHRKFAVTINLNAEAYAGGDLRFPEFGERTYRAPTGGAVVFSCSLMHEATPVTAGRRYAFLPFLYDEAGAAVREANLATVAADAVMPDEG